MKKAAVLITGASSGIGAATALYFSEKNHTVILTGRNEKNLKNVAKKLPNENFVIPCDLRDPAQVGLLCDEAIDKAKHLSIIVNNAGIFERRVFNESDDGLWNDMYETNLLGPVRVIRNLSSHLKKIENSVVINIASTAGLRPLAEVSAYTSIKAALISLTQSLALEYAKDKIRFNCVCPGIVDTPIHSLNPERRKAMAELHPLNKLGSPIDVAQAIYYLTTPETSWMTGVILPVDGGLSLT